MKPKSKLQLYITEESSKLPKLTEKQKKWIFDECLLHKGYATKNNVICLDCGNTFSPTLVNRKRASCRHCNTKLKIEDSRRRTDYQREYAAMAILHEGFQVIRHFEIRAHYKKGKKADYYVSEILEQWITEQGKVEMIGKLHQLSYYGDSWAGDWSIRKNYRQSYNYNGTKYLIYPYKYLPGSKFRREYTKIGINKNIVEGLTFLDAIKIIPSNPQAETLLKAKQYSLLHRTKDYRFEIADNWPSIKICLRNKYKVKKAGDWLDYIGMLKTLNKDFRNAKYVCPKNLKQEHNKLVQVLQRQRERERAIRDAETKAQKEARKKFLKENPYRKRKAPYIGLMFSKGNITISFLNSVKEVKEEGKILKHCVYQSKYHEKDTLLFSATVDGEKIATAEVCLKRWNIEQVRGYDNDATEYDETIIKLIRKNMKLIAERAKPKVKRKKRQLAMAS